MLVTDLKDEGVLLVLQQAIKLRYNCFVSFALELNQSFCLKLYGSFLIWKTSFEMTAKSDLCSS